MRHPGTKTVLLALVLSCAPPLARASVTVDEEEVVFRLEAPGAGKVYLVGDFNGWNPTMDGMTSREGPWEVSLFLVPGRYRYQFVVDGERISDPDNPHRDPDGTTYFIFTETDGGYAIVFEPPREGAGGFAQTWRPVGRGAVVADSSGGLFTGAAGLEGEVGGGVSGSMLVGFEYESGSGGAARAYLLRATGRWESGRGRVEAFHRTGDLDLGDPLALFGTVGPFRYPLGLFARGAGAGILGPAGITGRGFYANRIEGYRSGLEGPPQITHVPRPSPYAVSGREDEDMIGLSLRGGSGIVDLEYLLRLGRGPRHTGVLPDMLYPFTGYRGFQAQGGVIRLDPVSGVTLTGEYLEGRTTITRLAPAGGSGEGAPEDAARYDWEEGYRAAAGIAFGRGPLSAGFDWIRTTISGDPDLREGRPEGIQDILEALLEAQMGSVRGSARIRYESFADPGNTGRVFWLMRNNFWLDGDPLTSGMLPFLDAPVVWEAELRIEQDRPDTLPGPYRIPGYIEGLVRFEPAREGAAVYELTAGQGIAVHRLLSLHADLRYVAYQKCGLPGDEGFLDAWFGMRAGLPAGGWMALGVGVAPHRFDRWLFDFAGDGREAYLLDTRIFRFVDSIFEEELLMKGLEEAERSLSEDWSIRFEAGIEF